MPTTVESKTKAKAKPAAAPKPLTDGEIIDKMFELREQRKALEDQANKIKAEGSVLEDELMARMEANKVDKMTGRKASVSISKVVVGNVEDWDKFHQYIYKNKAGHLLQRRVSDPAYRELLETLSAGKQVPGVTPFTKKTLGLRVLASAS